MKTKLALAAQLLILLASAQACGNNQVDRNALDRLWEDHMLIGTSAVYLDGRRDTYVFSEPPEYAEGFVLGAGMTTRGIQVIDHRGTAFFGLLHRGGYALYGGLLGQVKRGASILELYGKKVMSADPGLWDHHPRLMEDTFEFFLLRRGRLDSRASVLKKWVIQPQDVRWYLQGREQESNIPERLKWLALSDVRGFLKYFPDTQEAEVTITGLTHPFVERVKVELK